MLTITYVGPSVRPKFRKFDQLDYMLVLTSNKNPGLNNIWKNRLFPFYSSCSHRKFKIWKTFRKNVLCLLYVYFIRHRTSNCGTKRHYSSKNNRTCYDTVSIAFISFTLWTFKMSFINQIIMLYTFYVSIKCIWCLSCLCILPD